MCGSWCHKLDQITFAPGSKTYYKPNPRPEHSAMPTFRDLDSIQNLLVNEEHSYLKFYKAEIMHLFAQRTFIYLALYVIKFLKLGNLNFCLWEQWEVRKKIYLP